MRLKSILPALVFVTTLSCAHVGPIASCATDLVVQVIQSDLGGSDWEGKITADILKYGVGVIDCVVNAIIAQAESRSGGAEPVVQHAKAYRAKHADSTRPAHAGGSVSLKSPGDDQVPTPPLAYGAGATDAVMYMDAVGHVSDFGPSIVSNDSASADLVLGDLASSSWLTWISSCEGGNCLRVTQTDETPARSLEEFMCRRASCSVER